MRRVSMTVISGKHHNAEFLGACLFFAHRKATNACMANWLNLDGHSYKNAAGL
jgi:hypothetical protein